MALAALSKRGEPLRNRWILAGSLIPDLLIFLWAPWQRWGLGRDWQSIWDRHYFEPPMQTGIALFNSVPIFLLILLIGVLARRKTAGPLLMVFALAGLLHIALDAPVHGHDAYRHFWPVSDWRFNSPISYWEAGLHARWVSLFEALIVILSAIILCHRFPRIWVKLVIAIIVAVTLLAATAQQLAPIPTAG